MHRFKNNEWVCSIAFQIRQHFVFNAWIKWFNEYFAGVVVLYAIGIFSERIFTNSFQKLPNSVWEVFTTSQYYSKGVHTVIFFGTTDHESVVLRVVHHLAVIIKQKKIWVYMDFLWRSHFFVGQKKFVDVRYHIKIDKNSFITMGVNQVIEWDWVEK